MEHSSAPAHRPLDLNRRRRPDVTAGIDLFDTGPHLLLALEVVSRSTSRTSVANSGSWPTLSGITTSPTRMSVSSAVSAVAMLDVAGADLRRYRVTGLLKRSGNATA